MTILLLIGVLQSLVVLISCELLVSANQIDN